MKLRKAQMWIRLYSSVKTDRRKDCYRATQVWSQAHCINSLLAGITNLPKLTKVSSSLFSHHQNESIRSHGISKFSFQPLGELLHPNWNFKTGELNETEFQKVTRFIRSFHRLRRRAVNGLREEESIFSCPGSSWRCSSGGDHPCCDGLFSDASAFKSPMLLQAIPPLCCEKNKKVSLVSLSGIINIYLPVSQRRAPWALHWLVCQWVSFSFPKIDPLSSSNFKPAGSPWYSLGVRWVAYALCLS